VENGAADPKPNPTSPEPADAAPAEGAASAPGGDANGGMQIEAHLTRDLGLTSALAIGVGTMIAAGIFTLSGLAVSEVGSAAIAAFLAAAVVATFTALTYCEFSSIYPESGEGYLYARKTFAPPMAYMVGWCLLLGYTASCGFYIASLSTYFNEFLLPESVHHYLEQNDLLPKLSGLLSLGALTLLNMKGTKESGSFQVVVTIGKVILLIIFIGGGILATFDDRTPDVLTEQFSTDMLKIGSTAALVFITFFGFSAIAASAGEVTNPTKTIPRAIFISMGVVTVLYTLVVLVMVAAQLDEYSESAMGVAAKRFLGPVGGMVIVGGALFSMISASNASIMAGSRVALSMSHLGHLPREIGAVDPRTRTPVIALVLVGLGIGTFVIVLPLEKLAHFADCVLLTALILVNMALVIHRRRYRDIERPFRVPLVPLLPILGILANIYLLAQLVLQGHVDAIVLASLALIGGFLGFLAWKGIQTEDADLPGEPSRVALARAAVTQSDPSVFRVLVPIANPANVEQLVDLAAAAAKPRGGEIVTLRVILVPEQTAPTIDDAQVERERRVLERARARAQEHGVHVSSQVRVGHDAARAILETSRQLSCNLIVLGWKGHTSTARKILGAVTDDVVRLARTDIMLVKLTAEQKPLRKLLLPSAGGEHARRAQRYAVDIAKANGGAIELCSVVDPEDEARAKTEEARLAEAKGRVEDFDAVETKLIRHRSIPVGIIKESEQYDAVVLGATRESFYSQILFGSIPEAVVRRASCPVILVKNYHPVKALVGRVMSE
jgi:amino acid transporter/nucleotide-binding universal stress UspA family protein